MRSTFEFYASSVRVYSSIESSDHYRHYGQWIALKCHHLYQVKCFVAHVCTSTDANEYEGFVKVNISLYLTIFGRKSSQSLLAYVSLPSPSLIIADSFSVNVNNGFLMAIIIIITIILLPLL